MSDYSTLTPRSEAALAPILCLLFKLAPAEGKMLAKLLTHDHCTKNDLCAVVSHSKEAVSVVMCALRAKLKPHKIAIDTLHGHGYGVGTQARARICEIVAEYDAGVALTRPSSKPKTIEPEANAQTT